ncbi:hypothetical protein [Acrocarpospora catenulata]|uniref:hypothetical protein n=1 Tax=Acrocarpospora catenulata TaxID=2836182 RepID=UPI001BDA60C7|nr:hypothetical protein [Acrocarpospora catenulata]
MLELRRRRGCRGRDARREGRPEKVVSLREELRRERFDLLARLAFALQGGGVACTPRVPGRRGEYPVLELPGGYRRVVLVGACKDSGGWRYTVGVHAPGLRAVKSGSVAVQVPDPVGRILRAVAQ